jgi:hypothetical protein
MEMENTLKSQKVNKSSELKEWLVEYTGRKQNPDNDEITVEMIINTVADDFPEFMLLVAEENYLRGYEQALDDINAMRDKYGQNTKLRKKKSKQKN